MKPDLFVPDGSVYGGLRLLDRDEKTSAELRAYAELTKPSVVLDDIPADRLPCPKHPLWQPARPGPAPLPPMSACPQCRDSVVAATQPAQPAERIVPARNGEGIDLRLERAHDRHVEKLLAEGMAVSGSAAEREAIQTIDRLREEEIERDAEKVRVRRRRRAVTSWPGWH